MIILNATHPTIKKHRHWIKISGNSEYYIHRNDSVVLTVTKYGMFFTKSSFTENFYYISDSNNYHFRFKSNIAVSISITIYRNKEVLTDGIGGNFLAEPGDAIRIIDKRTDSRAYAIQMKGVGSAKYNYNIHFTAQGNRFKTERFPKFANLDHDKVTAMDSLCNAQLAFINDRRNKLSPYSYNYLKLLALLSCEGTKYQIANLFFSKKKIDGFQNDGFQAQINSIIHNENSGMQYFGLIYNYIINKYRYDYKNSTSTNLTDQYRYLKKILPSYLKYALLCKFLTESVNTNLYPLIEDALSFIKVPPFRSLLERQLDYCKPEKMAYNFDLPDINGVHHRLSDYRDTVVVLDFWFTGCGNCRRLRPVMEKIEKQYLGKKVKFLSISIDKQYVQFKHSVESGDYTAPSSINLYTDALGVEAEVIKLFHVNKYPTLIVISPKGSIGSTPIDPRFDSGVSLISIIDPYLK
ncbi:TlpA family protein disulfide reductase [Rhizosphaericola mali]|nr:TlpA disulfide reductase family protein [Rhizosphaericola mali]